MIIAVNRLVFEKLYSEQEIRNLSSTELPMVKVFWSVDGKSYLPIAISTVQRATVFET